MLAIFSDPQTFSSENTQAPYRPRPPAVQQVLDAGLSTRSGLSAIQPPDHTRLRAFVNKAFTPRRVAVLEPRIRELAEGTVERMAPRGRADWVGELAYELPALVIWGEPDRWLGSEMAQPDPRWVRDARLERIPGTSHWVQADAPDRVNELLLSFLR